VDYSVRDANGERGLFAVTMSVSIARINQLSRVTNRLNSGLGQRDLQLWQLGRDHRQKKPLSRVIDDTWIIRGVKQARGAT